MASAPLPFDETGRLAALRACEILDTAPERAFDGLVALAARLTNAPIALLSFVDQSRQWFKARVGLGAQETPREQSFCAHAILESGPLIVEDATRDTRFTDNALVTGQPGIRFYAGYPLELSDGARVGTLCVIETRPRTLSADENRLLAALAEQATSQLELRRALLGVRKQRAQERLEADRALEARAQESFRISRVLQKSLAVQLDRVVGTIKSLIHETSAGQATLRDRLLEVSNQVADAAIDCQTLATHIRDFALLRAGWLGAARADVEELQQEHRVRITLEAGVDPGQLLSYSAAYRLSECVHAALSELIGLCGARRLNLALTQHESALLVTIRHDGRQTDDLLARLNPAAPLRVLASELGGELVATRVGDWNALRFSVALPAPSGPAAA
ncbi:MAG: GAF domain-containing protein [Steroidobacteraceae bacterium]